jgi:hypothetical protein
MQGNFKNCIGIYQIPLSVFCLLAFPLNIKAFPLNINHVSSEINTIYRLTNLLGTNYWNPYNKPLPPSLEERAILHLQLCSAVVLSLTDRCAEAFDTNFQESTGTKTSCFHASAILPTFSSVITWGFHIFFLSSNKSAAQNLFYCLYVVPFHSTVYARHSLKTCSGIFFTLVKVLWINNLQSPKYISQVHKNHLHPMTH